jgi:hypothetical protein
VGLDFGWTLESTNHDFSCLSNMDFTSSTNHCGQTILRLVSHGNAIIAETLRLGQHIPENFYLVNSKYKDLIFDFRYMNNEDVIDSKIQSSAVHFAKNNFLGTYGFGRILQRESYDYFGEVLSFIR